jgi:hypothetical protein
LDVHHRFLGVRQASVHDRRSEIAITAKVVPMLWIVAHFS